MPELHATETRIDGVEIVEVAPLEDAGRKVAFRHLDRMEIAKGEGAAFLLVGIEPRTPAQARLGPGAGGEAAGLEPAVGKGRLREISALDGHALEETAVETTLREVDAVAAPRAGRPLGRDAAVVGARLLPVRGSLHELLEVGSDRLENR